jgi:hypothetical protein
MRVRLNDIHSITQTPGMVHEIGGYFTMDNNRLSFHKTAESTLTKGRHSIQLPNGGLVWHAHPFHAGWWPSYEDITRMRDNIHILFTFHGAWIYKPARSRQQVPKPAWKRLHDYLISLPSGWNANEVLHTIQTITSDMKTDYGLDIVFVPYFTKGFPSNQNTRLLNQYLH